MKRVLGMILTIMVVAGARPLRAADGRSEARALVEQTVDQVMVVLRDATLSQEAKRERVMEIIEPVFDFRMNAILALGRDYLRLDDGDRETFRQLHVQYLQNKYWAAVDLAADAKVEVTAAAWVKNSKGVEQQTKVAVTSRTVGNGSDWEIVYYLHRPEPTGPWYAYDVEINGVSVRIACSQDYRPQFSSAGASGLFSFMKENMARAAAD